MGQRYFVEAKLSGVCMQPQKSKYCKTFIGLLLAIIRYRLKYPIVTVYIRNGFKHCDDCKVGENKPLCYMKEN